MSFDYSKAAKLTLEEIRHLERVIKEDKELLQKYPDDFALEYSLKQLEARLEKLKEEYKRYMLHAKRHLLDLVLKVHEEQVELEKVINPLESFYGVLNTIYQEITHKKENIPIYFDTVYKGSFGVLLSTPFDDKQIASDYEATFDLFFQILNLILKEENKENIHDILHEILKGNKDIIKKIRKFIKTAIDVREPISVEWTNPIKNKKKKIDLTQDDLSFLDEVLEKELAPEVLDIEISGKVVMVDLSSKKMKIELDITSKNKYEFLKHKKKLTIDFPEYLIDKVKKLLDEEATFKIKATIIHNEITEEEKESFELIEVKKYSEEKDD
ncbi:hypothetical protein [Persephonella sp.]